jgi:hypothetical protein
VSLRLINIEVVDSCSRASSDIDREVTIFEMTQPQSENFRILIAGGGIAGLAAVSIYQVNKGS